MSQLSPVEQKLNDDALESIDDLAKHMPSVGYLARKLRRGTITREKALNGTIRMATINLNFLMGFKKKGASRSGTPLDVLSAFLGLPKLSPDDPNRSSDREDQCSHRSAPAAQ